MGKNGGSQNALHDMIDIFVFKQYNKGAIASIIK